MKKSFPDGFTAADIMTTHVVTIDEGETLAEAMETLLDNHVSGAPVVDAESRCVGIISATDILSFEEEQAAQIDEANEEVAQIYDEDEQRWEAVRLSSFSLERIADVPVIDVMTREPITVRPTTPVRKVATLMVTQKVHRVIVVDELRKLKGIVSATDFVRALIEE